MDVCDSHLGYSINTGKNLTFCKGPTKRFSENKINMYQFTDDNMWRCGTDELKKKMDFRLTQKYLTFSY
jgi:hypothetical protein